MCKSSFTYLLLTSSGDRCVVSVAIVICRCNQLIWERVLLYSTRFCRLNWYSSGLCFLLSLCCPGVREIYGHSESFFFGSSNCFVSVECLGCFWEMICQRSICEPEFSCSTHISGYDADKWVFFLRFSKVNR